MQAPLPPLVIDALVQTESVSRENEACQTEKSTGIECGVQANPERRYKLYPERRTLGTQTIKVENVEITRTNALVQTDGSTSKDGFCQTEKLKGTDFQVQVDFQPEKELPSTIQEENMEVSDDDSEEDFQNDSRVGSDNDSEDDSETDSEAENWIENVLDDEERFINLYWIYWQSEDPKNAIEKIKNLKNCLFVHEPKTPNSQDIETGVKTISNFFGLATPFNKEFSPDLNQIKSFVMNQFGDLGDTYLDAFKLISQCTTTIKMIQPNGYEYWIVKDFEKGRGISKWYRGHACESVAAENLAFLNLAGITVPAIDLEQLNSIRFNHDAYLRMSDFVSDAGIIFTASLKSYTRIIQVYT